METLQNPSGPLVTRAKGVGYFALYAIGGLGMADVFTAAQRSAVMSSIRGKDTTPEMIIRRLVWRLGFRYRLHRSDLPGRPDLAFPGKRKVIFVHGCFWHQHEGCRYATTPSTRREFWQEKFEKNMRRDKAVMNSLDNMGWKTLVIWECETRKPSPALETKIREFLVSHEDH